jgi:acyl-CoA synthetase (AMP-forming)/AMP-acid ligase II
VYPREIEAALETHPAVAQAAVIGVPDAQFQEVGCGFVQLKPSQTAAAAQLTDYLRTRLANYKIPKQLRFVEQLPLLPIGKVDKQQLRALLVSSVTSDEREASR